MRRNETASLLSSRVYHGSLENPVGLHWIAESDGQTRTIVEDRGETLLVRKENGEEFEHEKDWFLETVARGVVVPD